MGGGQLWEPQNRATLVTSVIFPGTDFIRSRLWHEASSHCRVHHSERGHWCPGAETDPLPRIHLARENPGTAPAFLPRPGLQGTCP